MKYNAEQRNLTLIRRQTRSWLSKMTG